MIIFETLRYKNLLSSGNYWTEYSLNNNQRTLVYGSNGSGKSTMLDALCFGLFGKAFRSINKPNLLNSINQKNCIVEIGFSVGGSQYKVVRGIKPNIFEIYQDNILIDQESATKDYQEILEKSILKLNYKSFTQIVILGSASFTPFMQLSAADRRSIIEDLLDINIFSTMNTVIKDRIATNKDEMKEKKYQIELNQQKFDIQSKHIEQQKQNNQEKIDEHQSDIDKKTALIAVLNKEVNDLIEEANQLQEDINKKLDIDTKHKKFVKLETQIENNLSKVASDVAFFQGNDTCPTCRQTIDAEFKRTELLELSSKMQEYSNALNQLEIKIAEEQEKLDAISVKQKELQKKQIDIATNNTTITETNKTIQTLKKEIDSLQNAENISALEIQELKSLETSIKEQKLELKNLIQEKTYYDAASLLLKDNGIKTKIIKQYLPIINKLVNKYLSTLDFFVNFNLDESFKETIKSRHRDDFTYNNFSEGEKAKINLSLLFAWRAIAKMKNSASTNLLILDEIVDSALDVAGIDNFFNMINSLDDNTSVFVISPKGDNFIEHFDNTIKFEKVKNFSRMVKA